VTRHHYSRPPVVRSRRRLFVAIVMSVVVVGSTVATLAIGVRRATPRAAERFPRPASVDVILP
jgi:hypothetical protein